MIPPKQVLIKAGFSEYTATRLAESAEMVWSAMSTMDKREQALVVELAEHTGKNEHSWLMDMVWLTGQQPANNKLEWYFEEGRDLIRGEE